MSGQDPLVLPAGHDWPARADRARPLLIDPVAATMRLVGVPLEGLEGALLAVLIERGAQAQEWGGADHDDQHTPREWLDFIQAQLARSKPDDPSEFRGRMVRIAALALAAIESRDRIAAALRLERGAGS